MKTITEFTATSLDNALRTKKELLSAGKTPEELPAAMGEALKMEGEKLALLMSALEVVEKKAKDLKRVVVWSLQEGEKPPRGTEQKGEHHFGIEYFPPMPGQHPGRGGRRGERERGRKGGRRDERKGGRKPRGPRREGEGAETLRADGDQNTKRRRRRGPRGPKPEGTGGPAVTVVSKPRGVITPRETPLPPPVAQAPASAPETAPQSGGGPESGKES